jgi:hypothetical protein
VTLRWGFVYLFRALGLGLGIPSLVSAAYFGWLALQLHMLNPGPLPPASGSSNTVVQLVETSGRLVGGILRLFDSFGEWVLIFITLLSVALFAFAILLWFTAGGLAQDKLWARVVASLCGIAMAPGILLIAALINGHE